MKKIVGWITLLVAIVVAYFIFVGSRFRLESISPESKVRVFGLPFQSSGGHKEDGNLRIYVGDFKQQTSIPWSEELWISWREDFENEVFEIYRSEEVLMRWVLAEGEPRCVCGEEYLVDDPYEN